MMRRFEAGGLIVCGTLGAVVGCGDAFEPTQVGAWGDSSEALLGSNSVSQSCRDQGRETDLNNLMRYGRTISRSSAYLECVQQAFGTATYLELVNKTYGPYVACGTGNTVTDQGHNCVTECASVPPGTVRVPSSDCHCDALRTATTGRQLGRILSATATPRNVLQDCANPLGNGSRASAPYSLTSGVEKWTWSSLSSPPDLSFAPGVAWHEAMHTLGYAHGNSGAELADQSPDNCGFGYDNQAAYNTERAATALVGACMIEVLKRSTSPTYGSCGLVSASCNPWELRVIRTLSGTSCECVPDVIGAESPGERFGHAVAAGDFDADGLDDLAVGAPFDGGSEAGVYVFRGSAQGLTYSRRLSPSLLTTRDYGDNPSGTVVTPSPDSEFGTALAVGDFDDDGYQDLAVGAPGVASDAGAVYIIGGSSTGLVLTAAQWLDQSEAGGGVEAGDYFGASLAAGDFDGDGHDDLAVGTPYELLDGDLAGVTSMFKGQDLSGGARRLIGDGRLHQEMGPGTNTDGDAFGFALAAGNVDADNRDELFIGTPGNAFNAGAVFRADKDSGTWSVNTEFTRSGSIGFGSAIAVGDIVGDSTKDLVVGGPGKASNTGAFYVWRATTTGLTFSSSFDSNETGDELGRAFAIVNVTGTSKRDLIVGVPGETFDSGPAEGRLLVFAGTTSTALATAATTSRSQGDFFDAGTNDTVLPPEDRSSGRFAVALAAGKFNDSGIGLAVGAPTDIGTVPGVQSGAVFVFSQTLGAGRKFGQVTVRYGDSFY